MSEEFQRGKLFGIGIGLERAAQCVETQTVGGNKAPGSASRVLLAGAIRQLAQSDFCAKQALELIDEIEMHCPCGARPESPNTHPHVIDCPVFKLKLLLNAIFAQSRQPQLVVP